MLIQPPGSAATVLDIFPAQTAAKDKDNPGQFIVTESTEGEFDVVTEHYQFNCKVSLSISISEQHCLS